ncbi:hypothetical protein [Prosthecobacter sp.]|uniref:hypothetical protein n=1 Tax=Prosthecobacter sp. TaxID=1965333 RepID=UPI003784D8D3
MKTDSSADDPWAVLELDATTASLPEVKRAYARLLKTNRPDQDPAGFMRLRAAYEAAQILLKGGPIAPPLVPLGPSNPSEQDAAPTPADSSTAPAPSPTPPPPPPQPAPEIPAEVKDALQSLRIAVVSKVRQKVRIAWAAYEELADKHDIEKESRWLLFIEVFAGCIPLLADACTDERLLGHLQHGEMRLLRLVTDLWSRQGDAKRLDEFCVSLNRQRQLVDSEIGAMAMVVTAIALGAWNPEQAARFAQRAFPRLPTSQRNELAARVDFETMLGRLVGPLPQQYKIPWVEVLRHGEAEKPWKEIISRDMVIALLRYCGPQWPGLAILNQKLSPQSWQELKTLAESLLR